MPLECLRWAATSPPRRSSASTSCGCSRAARRRKKRRGFSGSTPAPSGASGGNTKMAEAARRPEDFLELVERARRGRLKLYVGFAAGVGKTYRMLQEAHDLKARSVDVVVGFV